MTMSAGCACGLTIPEEVEIGRGGYSGGGTDGYGDSELFSTISVQIRAKVINNENEYRIKGFVSINLYYITKE